MIPSPEIRELTIRDYFDIVWKRIWIVITIVVVVGGFVAFRSFSSPKIYQVSTKILIKQTVPQITGKEELIYHGGIPSKEDQLALLQSRIVAKRVIKKLNLIRDEEFIGIEDPEKKLLSMIKVESSSKSNIIILYVKGKDPLKITSIANTWTKEFINTDMDQRVKAAKYGVTWLGDQLDDTLKKLQAAEKKLTDFTKKNRIVTLPDVGVKQESLIESLKKEKADLEKEITEASQRYKAKHPKMISLKAQLEGVNKELEKQKDALFSLQEKTLNYKILRRDVDTYKTLYDSLLKRMRELEITKGMFSSNIQIIDEAHLPDKPLSPQPLKDIFKALIVSLVLAIGLCFFLEHLDSTLKTSEDVEFYVRMPFLGYIPSVRKEAKTEEDLSALSHLKLSSPITEAFRNAKVSLIFSFPEDKPLNTVVVTSAIPKEGKSFVSSNLAIVFAQEEEKTLLIDADMRRGVLEKRFKMDIKYGLSNVLTGSCSLEDAISSTFVPNLYLMPSGARTPNPGELLNSEKLKNILKELKEKFTRIVIDSSPVLSVSDAIILGGQSDGLVCVIKAGFTSLKFIIEAKKILADKVKIIGAILNNVDVEKRQYYYYYYPQEKKA